MAVSFKAKMPPPAKKPMVGKKDDYTEHLVSSKGVGETVIEKKTGKEDYALKGGSQEEVTPGMLVSSEELMQLEVQGGKTINLGNYESARISVSLRMPCSKSDLEEAYKFATDWVSQKVEEATKAAQ